MSIHYFCALPDVEDSSRYDSPHEEKKERWEEPEDHIDWLEKNFPDETDDTNANVDASPPLTPQDHAKR